MFAIVALSLEYKTFIVYVTSFSSVASLSFSLLDVFPFHKPQIASLIVDKTFAKGFDEYINFADIFFPDLASKLPKHTGINDHAIELVNSQQPSYRPIYSLEPIELKTLKAYIKTPLVNKFIRSSKSSANILILFVRKSNGSLRLCVNYRVFNNLTIKN